MDSFLLRAGFSIPYAKPLFLPISTLNPTLTLPSDLRFSIPETSISPANSKLTVMICSSFNPNHVRQRIKSTTGAVILTAATALMIGKISQLPARAESRPMVTVEKEVFEKGSPLSQFQESYSDESLLQKKLEHGENEEALKILKRLVEAQPSELVWKFLIGRLLIDMGEKAEARKVFEEILTVDPLHYSALFENSVLMDQNGEGEAVTKRLQEALKLAEQEYKEKEARDVRLVMAQIQFLRKKVDEALRSFQELIKEDPNDYRPYFCRGVIYSCLDRNKEAREQFAKFRELSSKEFEEEGVLQPSLWKTKLFGKDSEN